MNKSNNSEEEEDLIINNDDCFPDEIEINYQIELYKIKKTYLEEKKNRNLIDNINFDEIMNKNLGVKTLIESQTKNKNNDLTNDILTLIYSENCEYKNISSEIFTKLLLNFIDKKRNENNNNNNMSKKNSNIYNQKNNILITNSNIINNINPNQYLEVMENNIQTIEVNMNKNDLKTNFLNHNKSNSFSQNTFSNLNFKQKSEKISNNLKQINKSLSNNNNIKANNKSKLMLYNKYYSEFTKIIEELFNNQNIIFLDKVNFNEFCMLMKKLGFINNLTINELNKDMNLIIKMYNTLLTNSNDKNYVSINHIFSFTLAILNINNYDNYKNFISNSTSNFTPLKLNQIQSNKIFKEYNPLNINWKINFSNQKIEKINMSDKYSNSSRSKQKYRFKPRRNYLNLSVSKDFSFRSNKSNTSVRTYNNAYRKKQNEFKFKNNIGLNRNYSKNLLKTNKVIYKKNIISYNNNKEKLKNYTNEYLKNNNNQNINNITDNINLNNKPLFILDINLTGNNKKRINVYKNQKTEEIVNNFIKENHINDEENEKLLINLINQEKNKFIK